MCKCVKGYIFGFLLKKSRKQQNFNKSMATSISDKNGRCETTPGDPVLDNIEDTGSDD